MSKCKAAFYICQMMKSENTIAAKIGALLLSKGKTMATAESCTGGNIAHLITLTPGSSAWYKGSVVSYATEVKIAVLGVSSELIDRHTVVSAQVAEAMADGVRRLTKTDFAISTTGIAGPDGGDAENPVGTVWIGVATPHSVASMRFVAGTSRAENIDKFSEVALQYLFDNIYAELVSR